MDMQTGWNENRALLRGVAAAAPTLSHENHGVAYETFPLSVLRLSGSEDRVNVIAARPLLEQCSVAAGTPLEVEGEVRSFNNKSGRGSRLVITLYARSLRKGGGEPANDLGLAGTLCKPPVFRRTPLGREICDLMLAVNRRCRSMYTLYAFATLVLDYSLSWLLSAGRYLSCAVPFFLFAAVLTQRHRGASIALAAGGAVLFAVTLLGYLAGGQIM